MCGNGIAETGLQEFDDDISGGLTELDHHGYPLSMIVPEKNCRLKKQAICHGGIVK